MMTHLAKTEAVSSQGSLIEQPGAKLQSPQKKSVAKTANPAAQLDGINAAVTNRAAPGVNAALLPDLNREGANMLELQARQSGCGTLLSMSSKATKALLGQF
jgi:hypothetical protein